MLCMHNSDQTLLHTCSRCGNQNTQQSSEHDFWKLVVEMRIMLDAMVSRNVHVPVVFGFWSKVSLGTYWTPNRKKPYRMLIETNAGFTMRTFKMDLEYEKIDRFISMRTSYLPRSKGDIGVLKATLRSCSQLKVGAWTILMYQAYN